MWEGARKKISFSEIMRVYRAGRGLDDEALDLTAEGRRVEREISESLGRGAGPERIEELRLGDMVTNRGFGVIAGGLKVTTKPDIVFLIQRQSGVEYLKLRRGENQETLMLFRD